MRIVYYSYQYKKYSLMHKIIVKWIHIVNIQQNKSNAFKCFTSSRDIVTWFLFGYVDFILFLYFFLINMLTALKRSVLSYLLLLQLVFCQVAALETLPVHHL